MVRQETWSCSTRFDRNVNHCDVNETKLVKILHNLFYAVQPRSLFPKAGFDTTLLFRLMTLKNTFLFATDVVA